jgi:hypothetical protein
MIEQFDDYIGTLPLTKVVKDKIEEMLILNSKIKKFEIKDIFVCELKNEEGARNYTSLWLFTDKQVVECKNFLATYDFDITPLYKNIEYCSMSPVNFDLEKPSDKSIVKIHIQFNVRISGDIIATENNCLSALKIYQKYIIPNLKD